MQTILLTVGRGPFPLTLARCFHAAGHKVIVADPWPRTLCHYSKAVAQCFQVPSPATANQAWLAAIQRIVRDCAVDLIVPIYEETLYLAQALTTWAQPSKNLHHQSRFLASTPRQMAVQPTRRRPRPDRARHRITNQP